MKVGKWESKNQPRTPCLCISVSIQTQTFLPSTSPSSRTHLVRSGLKFFVPLGIGPKGGYCHIPYIHASCPDFGNQIRSGPILRSASDPIYDKLPKFISYSFNVITAYSFIQ
jgi:hypothetical protein